MLQLLRIIYEFYDTYVQLLERRNGLTQYLQLELREPPVTWATRRFKLRTHAVPTQKLLLRTEVQESRSMSFEKT